jgi:nucleoside-diphosphate-sugar epimerase
VHRPATAVIGAQGFLGSALRRELAAAGVPFTPFTRESPLATRRGAAASLRAARVVFHMATSINPAIARDRPERVAADHAQFTRLLDLLAELDSPPVVVFMSSGGAIYSPASPPPYAEDAPTGPSSAYGMAKLVMEAELERRWPALPGMTLRLANAYGPGQRTGTGQGVIAHWLEAMARDEPATIFGDPDAKRDYVYSGDVCRALLSVYRLACEDHDFGRTGPRAVNIGSGTPTSLRELHGLVEQATGRRLAVTFTAGRSFDRRDVWLDARKAAMVLCWRPKVALLEGISRAWRQLQAAQIRA